MSSERLCLLMSADDLGSKKRTFVKLVDIISHNIIRPHVTTDHHDWSVVTKNGHNSIKSVQK